MRQLIAALLMATVFATVFVVTERQAEALIISERCKDMNAEEWPCWIIALFLCPCTWPDETGGGGSGGGNLPMAYPPPPPGWGVNG